LRCLLVLARDEIRVILRSRRGRFMTAIYLILNLLPLLLYLWLRSRTVITWPVDAADIALYLRGHRLLDLALISSLAHDLLTRGDREGWQDGFATLPIGELTWLTGRLAGRLVCLLLAIVLPWSIGYLLGSAWAGAWLDPLPFAGIMIARQLVSLALLLPVVIMAGCIGGSLVGAFVVLVTTMLAADLVVNLTTIGALKAGLPAELFGATGASIIGVFLYEPSGSFGESARLLMALFSEYTRSDFLPWWYGIMFHPDGGRRWPPLAYLPVRAAMTVAWLLFLSLVPFLLRLRRRAGRLQIRLTSLPTFSQWFSELVDEVRPSRPEGLPARLLSRCAGLVLVLVLAWGMVAVAELGGRELSLQMPSEKRPVTRSWPTRLTIAGRSLELSIARDGLLTGRQVLTGVVTGRPDRPIILALAPGMRIDRLSDAMGQELSWQRDLEQIRVVPQRLGKIELEIAFSGRPQRLHHHKIYQGYQSGTWFVMMPQIRPLVDSGQRRWMIDLAGLSWAPEPVSTVTGKGAFGGREPCLGETRLELSLPGHLVPVPLPGAWQERRTAGSVHASWHGLVPFLPPVVAGALQRSTEADVTVVCQSAGTDRQTLLRRWRKAWAEYGELPGSGDIVLWLHRGNDRRRFWRGRPIRSEPDLTAPCGLVSISSAAEIRRGVEDLSMGAEVAEARAHIRFFPLLPRLDLAEGQLVRRLLWTICANLERPREWREQLVLGNLQENSFRSVDLQQPIGTGPDAVSRYRTKLAMVTSAMISLLGSEQVAAGLQRLAAGDGRLTVDDIWQELAADRSEELTWFRDEVLLGSRVAAPRLSEVVSQETETGWHLQMTITNEGDAMTVVPLRLVCGGVKSTIRVTLPARQQVTVTRQTVQHPEQAVLDPDGTVLRRQVRHGNRWRRGLGVQ
jgi:hypothetical protein